jgi:hypothetical protein
VLGDRVQRNIESRSEVGDPGFAASEQGDDLAARWVSDGRERLIERCRIFNHLVEYSYDDLTRSSRLSLTCLKRVWPRAKLVIVGDAGHDGSNAGIIRELFRATDQFAKL